MKFFILLDTSGSMDGAKIGALNDAMSNILVTLQGAAFDGSTIELAIMTFGKTTQWMYESPKSVMDFGWKELKANGMTPLGSACLELDAALKKYSVPGDKLGIIVLSDGCPTDDFEEGITTVLKNKLFIEAYRYAVALGDNADIPSLKRFVVDDTHLYTNVSIDGLFETLNNIIGLGISQHKEHVKTSNNDDDDEWA